MKKKPKRTYYRDEKLLAAVGERIRARRNSIGVSIENLANDSGIDYTQLSRMELGKVNCSISILTKVALSLKINYKELLPEYPI